MAITVGKAIKILRESKGRSLGLLAKNAGVSVPYLSLIEADKRKPSMDVLQRLGEALGISADIFLLVEARRESSLRSTDDQTVRLLDLLKRMELFEKRIKDAIENREKS